MHHACCVMGAAGHAEQHLAVRPVTLTTHISQDLPNLGAAILAQALLVEAIDLRRRPGSNVRQGRRVLLQAPGAAGMPA